MWILGYCNSSVEPNKSIKFGTDVVYDMGIHHIKFQLCYAKFIFFEKSKGSPLDQQKRCKIAYTFVCKNAKVWAIAVTELIAGQSWNFLWCMPILSTMYIPNCIDLFGSPLELQYPKVHIVF